jgi:DNA glycosylase AlkZ-like
MELTGEQARTLRLKSLLLSGRAPPSVPTDVAGVVEWFGAMQAQELGSGLWSLGARLPSLSRAEVTAGLERRQALRTWPMRGTVHFIPPRDARWMLDLMGSRALAGAARRRDHLGLSQATAERAVAILGEGLAGGQRLTRSECVDLMRRNGIDVAGQRSYHLLWYASQCGVTCIAPNIGPEQTFVRLDEWAPQQVELDRDQALATIALRFVRSHGPAPVKDLAGWTGLPLGDVRRGVGGAGEVITTVLVDGLEMLVTSEALDSVGEGLAAEGVLALPGFDEFLLGYKDRSLLLDRAHQQAVIPGGNGIFQWTVVRDGRVIATWKRVPTKTKVTVDVRPLVRLSKRDRIHVEDAMTPYGRFVGLPVQVRWPD